MSTGPEKATGPPVPTRDPGSGRSCADSSSMWLRIRTVGMRQSPALLADWTAFLHRPDPTGPPRMASVAVPPPQREGDRRDDRSSAPRTGLPIGILNDGHTALPKPHRVSRDAGD